MSWPGRPPAAGRWPPVTRAALLLQVRPSGPSAAAGRAGGLAGPRGGGPAGGACSHDHDAGNDHGERDADADQGDLPARQAGSGGLMDRGLRDQRDGGARCRPAGISCANAAAMAAAEASRPMVTAAAAAPALSAHTTPKEPAGHPGIASSTKCGTAR